MKKKYTIVIGADHRGYALKQFLTQNYFDDAHSISWIDVGTFSEERTDYPQFAIAASKMMLEKKAEYGVLLCATGIGMAVAANRFPGIYAGVVWDVAIAKLAKEDDNITMLVLPSDYVTEESSVVMIKAWLNAEFKQGRYQQRIEMIDAVAIK